MYEQKQISHSLKAPKSQILDDLNGIMTPLQRRVMKELLKHLDELNEHIRNLNDEIDNFMKPEEKEAAQKIQDIPGIGKTSAQAVISVIGTDMSRFPTDRHISAWAGVCPGNQVIAQISFTKCVFFCNQVYDSGLFLQGIVSGYPLIDGIGASYSLTE